MPASIPYTTAGEGDPEPAARAQPPGGSWMVPASSRIGPSMATPR